MKPRRTIILVITSLLAASRLAAQESAAIDFPFQSSPSITCGDLRPAQSVNQARLELRNTSGKPMRVRVPAGTPFGAVGAEQGVIVLSTASMTVPPGVSLMPLNVLCREADRPEPQPSTAWRVAEHPDRALLEKQSYLRQLSEGLEKVDGDLAALARSVRIENTDKEQVVRYQGDVLTPAAGHLLRSADWSMSGDGVVGGVLNRTVVVQFAFWSLTDSYTDEDLARRLVEPRFAAAQAREASIRWGVQHLLEASGFKPAIFDAQAAESAYNRGVEQLRRGELAPAEDSFRLAVERRPAYEAAWFNLALTRSLRSDWTSAEQAWEQVAQLSPQDGEVWYNRGAVAYRRGDFQKAEQFFAKAVERDSVQEGVGAWLERARARIRS